MIKKYTGVIQFCLLGLGFLISIESTYSSELRVGYVPGGLYEQYINQYFSDTAFDEFTVRLISTEGSRHQTELLNQGKIDLALIQNDIAYYAYEGKRGYERYTSFSLVLPLFPEYLQIIVKADSDIFTFGKLFQGAVSIGPKGSGTYQNATDLFTELGFRPGVDFEQKHFPINDALKALIADQIDGVIYTGGSLPTSSIANPGAFRMLNVPESIMEAMTIRSSYYTSASIPSDSSKNQEAVNTLALTALLVASNNLHQDKVLTLIEALTRKGDTFQPKNGQNIRLLKPESAIEKSPIPLHDGLKSYLRKQGHLGEDFNVWLAVFVICFLIGAVVYVQIRIRSYDRMGNLAVKKGSALFYIHQLVAKTGNGLIVIFTFSLLVILFIEAIQYFEDEYARQLNVSNPFADKGYQSTFLWVITFMGAGDPGDLFPNSPMGKLLASALPFLGIGAVLGFGFSAIEKHRENVARAQHGTLKKTIRDHVLICGWNEKAVSIIYSLTGNDAPRKRDVIVIAEMDEDSPLEKYGFDSRYVSYCRGDSAEHEVLSRANAKYADIAVVLGGVKKRTGKNIKSILSTLVLKEMARKNSGRQNEMMVIAELLFQDNRLLFEKCGANHIVSSENIIDRVAAMSSSSPYTVDFVMDMLTYDDHSELYALSIKELKRHMKSNPVFRDKDNYKLKKLAQELLPRGIRVVAAHNTGYKDEPFLDHVFSGEKFTLMLDENGAKLTENDELLVLTEDYKQIPSLLKRNSNIDQIRGSEGRILHFAKPSMRKVILVGDLKRCLRIAEEFKDSKLAEISIFTAQHVESCQVNVVIGDYTDESKWLEVGLHDADQITILARAHNETNSQLNVDRHELDAEALLIAKFSRMFSFSQVTAGKRQKPLIIAAEMLSTANKQLFEDAGVDVVIPSSLIVERIITKIIYSRGTSTRFLMALLRMDDRKHLMTFELDEVLPNASLLDLETQMPDYFQLLGVLPAHDNGRENFINNVGDFRYHFLTTSIQAKETGYTAHKGDILVGIVDQNKWVCT